MTITRTHAYADSFGLWHAEITQTGVGNDAEARDAALSLITDEIATRQGAPVGNLDVTLASRTSAYGELTSFYRECAL